MALELVLCYSCFAMSAIFILMMVGICIGLLVVVCLDFFEKKYTYIKSRLEERHRIEEAQEHADFIIEKAEIATQKYKEDLFKQFEPKQDTYEKSIRHKQSQIDKKSHQLKLKTQEMGKKTSIIKQKLSVIQRDQKNTQTQLKQIKEGLISKNKQLIEKITQKFSFNLEESKNTIKASLEKKWLEMKQEEAEKYEQAKIQTLQKDARYYLNLALNRFERAYCPRRTVEPVSFKNKNALERVAGKNQEYIKEIEKECGVDLVINEENLSIKIFGIDSVRKELGRISIRSLIKKRTINNRVIRETVRHNKKELLNTIYKDGKNIARNLKLRNIKTEVLNMMGALKYRYSFAQNQYYHCEEVGWLCGLLSSELGLTMTKGRRAGMFHDIGKAMDHAREGSHAVLGAEFLSKYEEKQDIVHAVRAHHHDEVPSTALAYLVIVADAISGSRPGARHFTEDSYTRKMSDLERIIEGFPNIEDAYIMSAGREMQVIVDNNKVSDGEALVLSKEIAREIEKTCSYPGLIKVTVVRHSEVYSIAQ